MSKPRAYRSVQAEIRSLRHSLSFWATVIIGTLFLNINILGAAFWFVMAFIFVWQIKPQTYDGEG